MTTLIAIQADIFNKINRGYVNFRKSPKERLTVSYLETRLEILEKQWLTFDQTHMKLITEYNREEWEKSEYNTNDIYNKTEDLYTDYKSTLKESLRKIKSDVTEKDIVAVSENDSVQNNIKLPRISIPTFSGHYSEWTTFKDLFKSLIHNNTSLTNVQKLHYLKSYLTGEAEQLLRHLPITNDNYENCWTTLETRFSNKKFISDCILKRFFNIKGITNESSNHLKELHDTSKECLNALKNIGINVENWDIIIIYVLSQKLDNESRKLWEAKVCSSEEDLPKLSDLFKFIEHRFKSLEFLSTKLVKNPKSHHVTNNVFENKSSVCSYCSSNNHKLGNCKDFAIKDVPTRRNFVQTNGLCFNCLGRNHSVTVCRLLTRCRICKKKHHSLLHSANFKPSTDKGSSNEQSVDSNNVVVNATTSQDEIEVNNITSCVSNTKCQVILATALVKAETNTGSNITLRSLLDQGSQASFITESAAQLLGLRKTKSNCVISGIGGDENTSLNSKQVVYIKLQSIQDPTFTLNVKAFVLKKLTSFLPERKVMIQLWPNLPKMKLADPSYNVPNKIDILLGAEVYCQIIADGLLRGPPGTPIAQNTKLGWILSGKVGDDSETNNTSCNHTSTIITMHSQVSNEEFNLKKFWELESDNLNYALNKNQFTPEEIKCEELYTATTKRDTDGRYVVKLPFRDDPHCKYGNSCEIAIKRFRSLEKRFAKFPDLKPQYSDVISEYLKLGHMQIIPKEEIDKPELVYLPYHEVIRNDKTTTKFRIVFNASSRDSSGFSLNSDLMVGPTIQPDLRHILLRWRLYPICLVADIVKMYRQIKVDEADTDFQRLVWRTNSADELQHLRLLRVTFGTASAPFLAVRTLQQVAYDEGKHFPLASEKVLKDFYMDDLLTGCETVSEGKQIFDQMRKLLSKGCFELQKWSSNDERLHNAISGKRLTESNLELKQDEILKILGLTWNRRTDEFEYSVQLPPICEPVTKRKVISDIARLYDPMGWISPAIVKAKIMIQKLWLSGIEWDDELPPNLLNDWITYRQDLLQLTKFKLPRWIGVKGKSHIELHGFSDASNEAFAAAVYMRVEDESGEIYVHLLTSKTKVAPIKQVSIPRLELCGAVLLTKLLHAVSVVLDIPKVNIRAWTDSTVVLAWLSSHPSRWKTFIANRASEILSIFDRNQWSHVASADNPADYASRGVRPSELSKLPLWKTGPKWLKHPIINYDTGNIRPETNLEEKKKQIYHVVQSEEFSLWSKYSSLRKLVRVLSYCRRFINKLKKAKDVDKLPLWLTATEINEAHEICVKQCQITYFETEIKQIRDQGIPNKKSKLTSLNPFLDDHDILRVGGRLERAEINIGSKHPIILPAKSHLTDLIIDDAHSRTLHGGPQLVLNYLRSKYWIMSAKNVVKMFVRKCVVCTRHTAQTKHQLMGQLPPARVTPTRPFYRSGVDYAGPIQIRTSKGRGHRAYKGYICLFVCMATRAIHLEAVSDLTSQGFLAAFKRFVARRGHCVDLFSDNGTNFVGAATELKTMLAQERSTLTTEIAECLANNGTTWHFIPPHAPHFGGIWEAGIKSTKHHLRRVIGNATLTFEEISTFLYQVEACLNSRPISQINTNPQDPIPLTPGHFLIGEPLMIVPEYNYESSPISSLKRWQLTQKMLQHFWRRWSKEYLSQFLHRYKWANKTPEPEIGDIVLVKEDNLPPAKWLLGIITEKHKGLDNVTRVVTLKCKGILLKRPVTKICVLPVTQ